MRTAILLSTEGIAFPYFPGNRGFDLISRGNARGMDASRSRDSFNKKEERLCAVDILAIRVREIGQRCVTFRFCGTITLPRVSLFY